VDVVVAPTTVELVVVGVVPGLGQAAGAGASFALNRLASFRIGVPPKRAQ
jgi:hypothetical protein